eukprot:SAG22_NODE_4605_length_1219_cov_1.893750_1_plen_335_part_01
MMLAVLAPVALDSLPPEVLVQVLRHLPDPRSLCAAAGCCRLLRSVVAADDAVLWRGQAARHWGWLVPAPPPGCSWKSLCTRLHSAAAGTGRPADQREEPTASFVVVGGAPADSTAEAGLAVALSVTAGTPGGPAEGQGEGEKRCWVEHPPPETHRHMPGVCRDLAGGLCVVGGLNPAQPAGGAHDIARRSAERYSLSGGGGGGGDWQAGTWAPLPELRTPRCCAGAARAPDGTIWAVGGGESMYRQSRVYGSTELLRCGAGDGVPGSGGAGWTEGPSMATGRCAAGVAVGYQHCRIYAAGGYGGYAGQPVLPAAGRRPDPAMPMYLKSAEYADLG